MINEGDAAAEKKPRVKKSTAKEESITFEAAMTRLEAGSGLGWEDRRVRALEDGKTSLEESMKLYEEGVALVRVCSGKLDEAERRVKVLTGAES